MVQATNSDARFDARASANLAAANERTSALAQNLAIGNALATGLRLDAIADREFQSHLIPTREALIWGQQPPQVQAPSAPVPQVPADTAGPTTRELALMASDVYRDVATPPPGYRTATGNDLARLGLRAEDLASPNSGFRARLYVKGEGAGAHYVLSFRGSAEGSDWKANFQQGVGLSSDHYARALMVAKAIGRHSDANVTITGHSLGGGLASATALATGRPATTFNAAGLSDATIDQANAIRTAASNPRVAEIAAFYVRGEVLSAVQDGGDRVVGALFGGLIGGALADAPEAYGTRHPLDAVRPEGTRWYGDNPVSRHGMDWVLSSLPAH